MALQRSPCALLACILLVGLVFVPVEASAQGNLRAGIPNLGPRVQADDQDYNSIAHTLGIHNQWIDPVTGPANAPFAVMDQLYGTYGYQRQAGLDLRPTAGVQKVALYASTNPDGSIKEITHAALQEADGTWTSKPGNLPLMRHADANALDGAQYGTPVAAYARQRFAANGGAFAGAFRQAGMRNLAPGAMDFEQLPLLDNGLGIAQNDGGTNLANPLNAGNAMNGQGFGNGFAKGIGSVANPKRRSSGGASGVGSSASNVMQAGGFGGFAAVSATANGFSASAGISFGGGVRQASQSCFGNDGSNTGTSNRTGANGNSADRGNSGSQAGNNIFVSIKGDNDTVTINTGAGGLVGKSLHIKINGNNDVVKFSNGSSTDLGSATRTTTNTSNSTGSLVGTNAKRQNGDTHVRTTVASGTGSLVGTKSANTATRAVAKNAGNIRTNSTAALTKTVASNTTGQTVRSVNNKSVNPGVAKTGLTSSRNTGVASARPRTNFTNSNLSAFANAGPMTNMLRSAAANRTYAQNGMNHFTANRSATNFSAPHFSHAVSRTAPANISLARRR